MANALIRIHVKNASNLNPDPFYATLKFSHPELSERLRALGYIADKDIEDEPPALKE